MLSKCVPLKSLCILHRHPPILFLNIGGNCVCSLCSWHIFTLDIYPSSLSPSPWELFSTCKTTGRSVKVCRNSEAILLPEPRLWKLNGGSVLGVHDTTVGTLISAGNGHCDPRGCMLERRQQSATDTKVNGNLNHEIFFSRKETP